MELTLPRAAPGASFAASNQAWAIGRYLLSAVQAPALRATRTPTAIRRDDLDHWIIMVNRSGTNAVETARGTVIAGPGVPHLMTLGSPFVAERSHVESLALFVPRDECRDIAAALERASNTVIDTAAGRLFADFLADLDHRAASLTPADMPVFAAAIRAMIAACIGGSVQARTEAAPLVDYTRRERVRQLIHAHLASSRLDPERLCRMAGLSRSVLYRLFEAEGGVARYIQRCRLMQAHRMLADPGSTLRIGEIATRCGFPDGIGFSRAFRTSFGLSPRDLQHATRAAMPVLPPARLVADGRADLEELLRRM